MKKIFLLLALGIVLQQANAQSFDKGSLVISVNYGVDVSTIKQTYSKYNVPNSTTSSDTAKAGSKNWNIEGEYGLFKWLGVGIHLKFDNYFTSENSSGYTPTAYGFEGGVLINIHLIRSQHFGLLVGGNIGFSTLTYTFDAYNDQIYGDGSYTDLHLSTRFYFGRFGINLNFYRPVINYASLTSNISGSPLGESIIASWLGTGGGGSIGVQYRFIN